MLESKKASMPEPEILAKYSLHTPIKPSTAFFTETGCPGKAGFLAIPKKWQALEISTLFYLCNKGEIPVFLITIKAIADHKPVLYLKSNIIRFHINISS